MESARSERSSALESKATGFPLPKSPAKLQWVLSLHDVWPRLTAKPRPVLAHDRFRSSDQGARSNFFREVFRGRVQTDTQMKSVGETMAIGPAPSKSVSDRLARLEVGSFALVRQQRPVGGTEKETSSDEIRVKLATPQRRPVWYMRYAFKSGSRSKRSTNLTSLTPGSLDNLKEVFRNGRTRTTPRRRLAASHKQRTVVKQKKDGFSARHTRTVCAARTRIDIRARA